MIELLATGEIEEKIRQEILVIKSEINDVLKKHSKEGMFFSVSGDESAESILNKNYKVIVLYDRVKYPRIK